ncbi:MAG TPA: hypothetical protein VE959_28840 [Bryobacteraceae bacterium]|nr:conserved hypothetical protein [Candidatus Sulfopaludibacter sp. SbA4]HYW46909.1 hypothetical protein [Bryobacteraceae bacterium]
MFRAGLAIAALGLVWTLWPAPGKFAYLSAYRLGRSRYHLGPRVAIDLGHFNDSPADARFRALGDLLTWDGYRVTRSKQYLVPEYLKDIPVLVIGNAMPYPPGFARVAKAVGLAGRTVFAPDEVDAVRDWVRAGGSLLLEADVPGSGQAAAPLAAALGLVFHDCPAPVFLPQTKPGEHAILSGRSEYDENIWSAAVLASGWIEPTAAAGQAVPLLNATAAAGGSCAGGKPLAVALEFGRGRVVALSVQLERDEDLIRLTRVDPRRAGNRQFVLNVMHWLSRAGN